MKKLILIFAASILIFSCKDTANKAGVVEDSKQGVIDSMKVVMANQKPEKVTVVHTGAAAAPVAAATTPPRKKWSGAAKGAVIGAGVGAVTGAVISKKRPAEGAIIGGLAGAGLGAGTGAILDSKKK